jgi:hypothetical protein
MLICSTDDGATWGNASALTFPPLPNDRATCGPSPGIQAITGARELYFSLRTLVGEEFLLISADFGVTWRASALGPALSECAIAFVPGADETRLVANCRPGADHLRRQQLWSRAGVPIGNVSAPAGVVDPSCAGSVVAAGPALFVSHASSATARVRMVVCRGAMMVARRSAPGWWCGERRRDTRRSWRSAAAVTRPASVALRGGVPPMP